MSLVYTFNLYRTDIPPGTPHNPSLMLAGHVRGFGASMWQANSLTSAIVYVEEGQTKALVSVVLNPDNMFSIIDVNNNVQSTPPITDIIVPELNIKEILDRIL